MRAGGTDMGDPWKRHAQNQRAKELDKERFWAAVDALREWKGDKSPENFPDLERYIRDRKPHALSQPGNWARLDSYRYDGGTVTYDEYHAMKEAYEALPPKGGDEGEELMESV